MSTKIILEIPLIMGVESYWTPNEIALQLQNRLNQVIATETALTRVCGFVGSKVEEK